MTPETDEPDPERRGRLASASERARREAENARLWAEDARGRSPLVAFGFDFYERDRARFGGLLAGAVAFRLFLWLLPFVLFLVGLLGAANNVDDSAPSEINSELGITGLLAKTVGDGAQQRGWWIAIVVGLFGMVWAGMGAIRAMRISHSAAWGIAPDRVRKAPLASLLLSAAAIGLILLAAIVAWIRHHTGFGVGLLAALAMTVVYLVGWFLLSRWLPHRPVPPRALIPGAILMAVGFQGLGLFTTYYLVDRAQRAASLYGAIGTALAILLWLYIVARLAVGSAVLNSELAARHEEAAARHRGSG